MGKRKGRKRQTKQVKSAPPVPVLSFGAATDASIRPKHWSQWVNRVHSARAAHAAVCLVARAHDDGTDDNETDLLATAVYLDPLNLDAWQTLQSYALITSLYIEDGLTPANAPGAALADYQAPIADTLEALERYSVLRSRGTQLREAVEALAPLFSPAARRLWGWLYERGRDHAASHVDRETTVCYRVRDLISGFDPDLGEVANPAATVLASPVLTAPLLIKAALDADRIEGALWTADYLQALVEHVPERAARDLDLSVLTYFVASAALIHWREAGTSAISWGHLAYSFTPGIKERAEASYLLASLLYESGDVGAARSLFEYTYKHAKDPLERWRAALRLTLLIGSDQGDMEVATQWAERAEQLRPDGQGFATLSAAARRSGSWLEALEAALRSSYGDWAKGDAEIRKAALLSLARNVVGGRKWKSPEEFERAMAAVAEVAPQVASELRDQLVVSVSALAEEYAAEREALAAEIEGLRKQVEAGGSPDSGDSAAAKAGTALVRHDAEIRKYARSRVLAKYPDVKGRALEGLIDAYALRWILNQTGTAVLDSSAPMVLYAKALEIHLRSELKTAGLGEGEGSGLGAVEHAINVGFSQLHERGASPDGLSSLVRDLRHFREIYRNGFVHRDTMARSVLDDMFEFGESRWLFRSLL